MYTFHEDPGHGWLEVPIKEIRDLDIADQISSYSYLNNGHVYLKEDCDLTKYLFAKFPGDGYHFETLKFFSESVTTKHYNHSCVIRQMDRFRE